MLQQCAEKMLDGVLRVLSVETDWEGLLCDGFSDYLCSNCDLM